MSSRAENLSPRVCALAALALLGALAYFGTLHAPFHYDDAHAIEHNPYIKDLSAFQETVGFQNIFNRSVLLFTYAVNHHLGGQNTFGYHLLSVLLHICVGILLYHVAALLLALESAPDRKELSRVPFLAAVLFELHPMAVEPTTYLSSRSSLLAAFFYLLTFYLLLRLLAGGSQGSRSLRRVALAAGALVFFILGAGSKETVLTLPLMTIIFYGMQTRWKNFWRGASRWLWLLAPLLAYFWYRKQQLGFVFVPMADPSFKEISAPHYFFTQFYVIVFYYLEKFFLPFNLNFEPGVQLVSGALDPRSLLGLGALAVLAGAVWMRSSRLFAFAALWAWVSVLPTSSFMPLKQIASEHRAYLSLAGLSLALALLLGRGGGGGAQIPRRALTLACIVILAALSINRGLDYRSEIGLWEDAALKSPNKPLVHNNLAVYYLNAQRLEEAKRELLIVNKLDPTDGNAYNNLGNIYFQQGNWAAALATFDMVIAGGSRDPNVYYNAGKVRRKLKLYEEALALLARAIEIKPNAAEFYFELGNVYQDLKRFDAALKSYRAGLKYNPGASEIYNNIGVIFWNLQSFARAEENFKQALAMNPDNARSLANLANLDMIQQRIPEAIAKLERVLQLDPTSEYARKLLQGARSLDVEPGSGNSN